MTDVRRFKEARDKGARFLLSQMHEDGSFGDLSQGVCDYYKVPAALHVAGYSSAANKLCAWIRKHGMMPTGDFGPRPEDADPTLEYGYIYFNTWVILGAHGLAQFDLSQRGMDFLTEFWDQESGGFYCHPTHRNTKTKQDLWVVAGAELQH